MAKANNKVSIMAIRHAYFVLWSKYTLTFLLFIQI